jgi:LmbE family N-acetylglucosaminyl deacetylase
MAKILVFAPHPDDEVLGCGGTIAKNNKQKDKVYLCIVTKAHTPDWSEEFLKNRPKEIEKSNKILGIEKTYFLDFPTAKLDTISQKELNKAVLEIVQKVKPDVVYTPHLSDLSKEHRLTFEAVLVATRPIYKNPVKKILSYEALSETEWGRGFTKKAFQPDVYVDISDTFKKKIEAMKAYKSELKKYPHPRSLEVIKALAQKRGSEAGLRLAEAFVLIREINR